MQHGISHPEAHAFASRPSARSPNALALHYRDSQVQGSITPVSGRFHSGVCQERRTGRKKLEQESLPVKCCETPRALEHELPPATLPLRLSPRLIRHNSSRQSALRGCTAHRAQLASIASPHCAPTCRSRGCLPGTIHRLAAQYEHGRGLSQHGTRTGRPRLLEYADARYLLGTVEHRKDRFLDELKDAIDRVSGKRVSDITIWRSLRRAGISKAAHERSESARIQYRLKVGLQYEAELLVFVDESACDRRTYLRKRAWALEGRQACRKQIFSRGKTYYILPTISLNGMLDCTVLEGSFDTASFTAFVRGLLDLMQPRPAPNSVVVMDNCAIHKSPELRELIESRVMKLEFLPAYSPDFNPIELAFSLLKYQLRRVGHNDEGGEASVIAQLYGKRMSIGAVDCHTFYRHCGYDC